VTLPFQGEGYVAARALGLRQPGWRATEAQLARLRTHELDALPIYGMPLRPLPERVIRAVCQAATEILTPPPSRGLGRLREAISRKLLTEDGLQVDPETEIVVTNGAMQAVNIVCRSLLNPGDEVLIPAPSFFFYGMVELAGATPVYVPTEEKMNWAWDVPRIEAAITPRTKLLILCSPVNPTGYVIPEATIQALCQLARDRNFLILADESYDRMVYDGTAFTSAAALHDFRDLIILVQSLTKSYAMAAWRIGYLVANQGLSDQFVKLLEWEILYGNVICQLAAAEAMSGPQDWLADISKEFQNYRDEVFPRIVDTPGLRCVKPGATPYMFVNVAELGISGDSFADVLVQEFGVPATGGSHFGSLNHVRLGFGARDKSTREELCRRVWEAASRCLAVK
jgi:aspartate/methionine/tyrosine aminotransferase